MFGVKLSIRREINDSSLKKRLILTEVFYNLCIASGNFRTVLLQTLHLSAGQIGIVSSLCSVSNIVAPPVWGAVSDRIQSVSKCFILCLALSAVTMGLIPVSALLPAQASIVILLLLVLSSLFTGPANNMMELWLVQVNNSGRGISYGSIRKWASFAFAAMGAVYYFILTKTEVYTAYILYFVFSVPAILIAFSIVSVPLKADVSSRPRTRFRDMPFGAIFSLPVLIYTVFSSFTGIAESAKNTYFVFILNDYGLGSAALGVFMAVSALCEMPTLIFSRLLIDRFGLVKPMVFCILSRILESALYALGHTIVFIVIAQIIKGLAAGLLMACQIQYIYKISPKGLEATTQTVVASVCSVVSIAAMSFSGFLLDTIGARSFYLLAAGIDGFAVAFLLLGASRARQA